MSFEAIKRNSAVNLVAAQILKQIKNNTLPPGSKLPSQRDLAVQLGVGRSSIREAVNALVVKGYLEPIQGKGTFIRANLPGSEERLERLSTAVQVSSIFNLMEARMLLECKSAALAAERAEGDDIQKLEDVFEGISLENQNYELFLESDMRFHIALAEATRNEVICEMTKLVLAKLAEHHAKLKTEQLSQTYKKVSVETALEVLKAVKLHKQKDAALWMERHLSAIKDELEEVL